MKAYLITCCWDFDWQLAIVIAKNEQSARKKFKKAMPEYGLVSIEERMIIK